jgi:hypothetical protein
MDINTIEEESETHVMKQKYYMDLNIKEVP